MLFKYNFTSTKTTNFLFKIYNFKNFLLIKVSNFLQDKIIENLKDILKMIEWNEKNGIRVMRISSELFPHKSNPRAPNYDFDFAIDLLKDIGTLTKKYGHRLTFSSRTI